MVQNQQLTRFMYGPQASAYATEGTCTTVLGRVLSFTPVKKSNHVQDVGLGEGFNYAVTYLGTYNCGGSVVYNPVDFDFLKHWVGPVSGSGTAGAPYVLTEDDVVGLTAGDIQVFTFEDANSTESPNMVTRYIGCVGEEFTLSGNLNGDRKLVCTASFVSRHPSEGTTMTNYNAVSDNSFNCIAGVWSWGSSPTALTGIQSFSIGMKNNLSGDDNRDIDSRFISQPMRGMRAYKFSLTIKMTSGLASTLKQAHYGQANTPLDGSTAINPTADLEFEIALSTGNKRATIWVDMCEISELSEPKSIGGGLVLLTVNGTARLGKGNTPIKWWTV